MSEALQILQKYWKHNSFRDPQEAIIKAVLEGKDTFALLPTGGGKSVCYQIPGMVLNGITLVISPLIALMKDQVESLQRKNIKAIALLGGISIDETSDLLDNCQFGNYKFLYLSPERLQQEWIVERLRQLPINLIAIDEAHCVSQWGHDFRPAYLKIKNLKEYFNNVPFIALTASATKNVQIDIENQLGLHKPEIFKKSFHRENLSYHILKTEDKLTKIQQVLKKNIQPSIIYVRNRKGCVSICNQLQALGFSATFYHGGLSFKEKEANRLLWMQNKVQTIVATNAFGMGIDKPDVKTVLHLQIPENLESYYQEVGRAGRNGEKAFGILISDKTEISLSKKLFVDNLITKDFLKEVYKKLNNYFQIAYGEGFGEQFSFNLNDFCSQYQFPILKTFNALQFLDRQGVISLQNENTEKVKIQFIIPSKEVIRYISLHKNEEEIITTILRTYSGAFENEVAINSSLVAKKANVSEEQVIQTLENLQKAEALHLKLTTNDSSIIFNEVREDDLTINRISVYLENRNKVKLQQFEKMYEFVEDETNCKNSLLLNYFGEKTFQPCGNCSTCLQKNKNDVSKTIQQIKIMLQNKPATFNELEEQLFVEKEDLIFAIQWLLDNSAINQNEKQQYFTI